MKIICTAEEAAEIIYACGGAGLCLRCALRGVCKDKEELFDAIHIAKIHSKRKRWRTSNLARRERRKMNGDGTIIF